MPSQERLPCWCGATDGSAIGHDYRRCGRCGTAVVSRVPAGLTPVAPDRDDGLYGKAYWLDHQTQRGFPDVTERARTDLSERCLFWLERLLENVRPPGRALEIGCGHGAFVSLLRELGFDAMGMDLSPWVLDLARRTFGVPVRQGTLQTVDLEPGFACIAAFDVLEHLVDPLDTVGRCARLLAPDGVLLLQTPCYRGEGPEWPMFQPDEHVYLFSETAVRELLERAGFRDVEIRPSLFAYDMWIAATPGKLSHHPPGDDDEPEAERLPASFRALLDLHAQAEALRQSLAEAEADRAERLRQVDELTVVARTTEAERIAQAESLLGQIEALTAIARKAEADAVSHAEALTAQLEEVTAVARRVEAERVNDVEALTRLLRDSEADRAARLEIIHDAEAQVHALQDQVHAFQAQVHALQAQVHALQDRLEQIERTTVWRVYRTLARKS